MCCLFGIYDYKGGLTAVQKRRLVSALATASEARGTDATGIAYNRNGHLTVYKRPYPAHLMRFRLPDDAVCIYLQVHTHIVQFFRKFYIFGNAVIAFDMRQYDFVSCELQLLNPLSDVAVCL